ncbi:MAG: excinuclease ABC subunit UvrA [Pyrinomonadaceae bacterium]|nr:excinuclease ABC subunit UvrA [Pyrinomonadaceae bacterium]
MALKNISVRGARQHNLKNIDIDIPRDKFTVITGLSGSGKSSLAFDTIYAEGQRRYVESLSAYARQFLDQLEKPDVDSVEGLSPAISIEQKTVSRSPRSTVGTVTEVYDYVRLLFSSIGIPHCPNCDAPIERQPVEQIIEEILQIEDGERIMILAPIVRGRKGEFKKELEKLHKEGFLRARIDGELRALDEEIKLKKQKNHTIEVVVDRLLVKEGIDERLTESVKTALKLTDGAVLVSIIDGDEKLYSEKMACVNCKINIATLEPRSFSFNSAYGACKRCEGIGRIAEVDPKKMIPDESLAANKLPLLDEIDKPASSYFRSALIGLVKEYEKKHDIGLRIDKAYKDIPEQIKKDFFDGVKRKVPMRLYRRTSRQKWSGVTEFLKGRMHSAGSENVRTKLEQLVSPVVCDECNGHRLRRDSLSVKIGGKGVGEYVSVPIEDSAELFSRVKLTDREEKIAGLVLREIQNRLRFLDAVGLGYLTLDRASATLSGGEGQRIRLATQIGSRLRGVLYVLDEPSIGLHPRDNLKLLQTLRELRDLGNTVLVVEHDEETIEQADFVIDLGPGAGTRGGAVVGKGRPKQLEKSKKSLTGQYLSGALQIDVPEKRRSPNGKNIVVKGAQAHNLKNINVKFPLGVFTVVTGVSGSGKSTLVDEILYRALAKEIYRSVKEPLKHKKIEGIKHVDKIVEIDQKPIGRTPRSNPATYTGVFGPIRDLYAMLPESRERGYKAGRFSFNVKAGRCDACEGAGMKRIEMNFLPDVFVTCDVCRGSRYNRETLSVKFKGLSIADLLDTTIEDALPILENIPSIKQKLQTLLDVGLGYLKLGQSATTISGGEAQRVKLSKELSKRATGKTIYILDEPTTGLHFEDVRKLLDVLQRLVDNGNTVIVIEHNLDVIKSADHIIDLGPEGGYKGGKVVAQGTPEKVARSKKSYTGMALKEVL